MDVVPTPACNGLRAELQRLGCHSNISAPVWRKRLRVLTYRSLYTRTQLSTKSDLGLQLSDFFAKPKNIYLFTKQAVQSVLRHFTCGTVMCKP